MKYHSNEVLNIVWQRAYKISSDNEAKGFRQDCAGRWIKLSNFNQSDNQYGWFLSKQFDDINIENVEKDKTIIPLHWKTLNEIKRQQKIELKRVNIHVLSADNLKERIKVPKDCEQYWQYANQISVDNEKKGFRTDYYGKWIQKEAFGINAHPYGWTLASVIPANKDSAVQTNIIPIHINTGTRLANEIKYPQPDTTKKKIKQRRESTIMHIIIFIIELITAIPRAIFSLFH